MSKLEKMIKEATKPNANGTVSFGEPALKNTDISGLVKKFEESQSVPKIKFRKAI
ncbi:MAG: hypothetical protein FWH08_00570 [Oscillospiraceae bacterium]|nr:hypothetical protein [Oscillospiraceae bacterium]